VAAAAEAVAAVTRPGFDDMVERACELMHVTYEETAPQFGWETQTASRKPWADVPEPNKRAMRAAVAAVHLMILEAAAAEIERHANEFSSRRWALHWPAGMHAAVVVVRGLATKDPVKQGETT
jgi:predicted metal-dependent enzyme (double-stranded beta helix superfamily)